MEGFGNSTVNETFESQNVIELDLNNLSNHHFAKPNIIKIKKTEENVSEFNSIKNLVDQNDNLCEYSNWLIRHAAHQRKIMKNLISQYEKRQESADNQIRVYEEAWIESADTIVEMRGTIESLKHRLRMIGEEEAIREILGDQSNEHVNENEE